jgi:hypothetical protein
LDLDLCSYDLTISVLLQNLVVVAGSHNFPLLAMILLVSRHGLLLAALISSFSFDFLLVP